MEEYSQMFCLVCEYIHVNVDLYEYIIHECNVHSFPVVFCLDPSAHYLSIFMSDVCLCLS